MRLFTLHLFISGKLTPSQVSRSRLCGACLLWLGLARDVVQRPEEEHRLAEHGVEVLWRQVERQREQPKQAHAQGGDRPKVRFCYPPELWQQCLRCKTSTRLLPPKICSP